MDQPQILSLDSVGRYHLSQTTPSPSPSRAPGTIDFGNPRPDPLPP